MLNMKKITLICFVILSAAAAAFADIARPELPPSPSPSPVAAVSAPKELTVAISASSLDKDGSIVISKAAIRKLNAALDAEEAKSGGKPVAALSAQTLVGGIFLSLALVFGGVWFVRARGPVSKPAVGIALLAIVGLGTTLVVGNVAPPRRIGLDAGILEAKMFQRMMAVGELKLQIVDLNAKADINIMLGNKKAGSSGEEEE